MKNQTTINSPVDVTAIGFARGMRAYPRRIEFEGSTYDFIDCVLRTVIRIRERISHIFRMSEGIKNYLFNSDGNKWSLLSVF